MHLTLLDHVDLYGSIHTQCVVVHKRRQHAAQIELADAALHCRLATDRNATVPIDNNGK